MNGTRGSRVPVLAACLALVLVLPAPTARADGVDDSIAELKTLLAKHDDVKSIASMKQLADLPDPRVTRVLVDLTASDRPDIAVTAYQLAAPRKDPGLLTKLKTRADNKKLAESTPRVYEAVLTALAVYADKSALDVLESVVPRYYSSNAEFAILAIRAYSTVRTKPVLEKLIKWLNDCEAVANMGGGYADPSLEARKNYEKCHAEIQTQLTRLTGRSFAVAKEWRGWWKDAESSFKFPDPPPAPPEKPAAPPENPGAPPDKK